MIQLSIAVISDLFLHLLCLFERLKQLGDRSILHTSAAQLYLTFDEMFSMALEDWPTSEVPSSAFLTPSALMAILLYSVIT